MMSKKLACSTPSFNIIGSNARASPSTSSPSKNSLATAPSPLTTRHPSRQSWTPSPPFSLWSLQYCKHALCASFSLRMFRHFREYGKPVAEGLPPWERHELRHVPSGCGSYRWLLGVSKGRLSETHAIRQNLRSTIYPITIRQLAGS